MKFVYKTFFWLNNKKTFVIGIREKWKNKTWIKN